MGKVRKMLFFWRFLDCLPKPLTITPSTAAVKRSRQAFAIRQASRQSVKCVFNYFISAGWRREFWLFKWACSLCKGREMRLPCCVGREFDGRWWCPLKTALSSHRVFAKFMPTSKVLLASMFPCGKWHQPTVTCYASGNKFGSSCQICTKVRRLPLEQQLQTRSDQIKAPAKSNNAKVSWLFILAS